MGQGGVKGRKERDIAFWEPSLWRQHLKQMEWRVLAEKVKGELMEMRGNASASLQFPATLITDSDAYNFFIDKVTILQMICLEIKYTHAASFKFGLFSTH